MSHGMGDPGTNCRAVPAARAAWRRIVICAATCGAVAYAAGHTVRAELPPPSAEPVASLTSDNSSSVVAAAAGEASHVGSSAELGSEAGVESTGGIEPNRRRDPTDNTRDDPPDDRPDAPPESVTHAFADSVTRALPHELQGWVDPPRLTQSMQLAISMLLLGMVPAFLLMTTSYIRIAIVLSLVRQAFGAQLLPMQVTSALAILCTGLVMWPTWRSVHEKAVVPWLEASESADLKTSWDEGIQPIREFMIRQVDARNVHLFLPHVTGSEEYPRSYDQVPLGALLPAFVLSELKTAFVIGFQIYLPFLVIDLVVAAATTSMGMFMLPPHMVSLPLKLLLFVMVDGWRLIVEMLLTSFP